MPSLSDRLDDFPDRFSPMLVKELRQGLRAKTFVIVFLVMQGLLSLILLAATAGGSSANSGEVISKIVFVLFSLAVLVIQPLRGVAALSSEIRSDTIDLMVLTRLSSLRIVVGKWVAIVSQSGLLAATIIPYLILRYYFGKMNLFSELMLALTIFLVSAGLTAVTVGLSGCRSVLIRGILPILGALVLVFAIFGFGFSRGFSDLVDLFAFEGSREVAVFALILSITAYLGWSALSLGASLIAPHAENHSTLRRLIALVLTTLAMAISYHLAVDQHILPVIWFIFAAPAIGTALAEPNQLVPSVCRSFTRRGVLGRLAGRLLYPGWPSAIGFSFLLFLIGAVFIPFKPDLSDAREIATAYNAVAGSLLLPGLMVIWARDRIKDRAASFILMWIGLFFFTVALAAMGDAMSNHKFLWGFVWNPMVLVPMMDMRSIDGRELMITSICVNAVYFVLLGSFATLAFRGIRKLENQTPDA